MEKKIIELTKIDDGHQCLLCCKNEATVKFELNRVKYGDSVISFDICNQCLAQMQKDIEVCQ